MKSPLNNINKLILVSLFAISIFFSIYFYSRSLNYYFFQDDFFEINISKASNLAIYLNFFKFRNDIIAYRPISLQNYFFFSNKLFGLNPTGARIVTFLIFLTCSFLIYKLIRKITNNRTTATLCASFWLTSAIHYMSLTWIAAAYNIIGTFFFMITSLLILKYEKQQKLTLYIFSIIAFLITIGSFEFAIAWPLIFTIYSLLFFKKRLISIIKTFLPFYIISLIYLLLRLTLIKVPSIYEYQTALNLNSIRALFWYILWSFNIPEEFKKQIVTKIIIFNTQFLIDYWKLVTISVLSLIAILTLTLGALGSQIRRHADIKARIIIFGFIWFLIAISPVLILPNHTFSMYLTLASIGLYLAVSQIISIERLSFAVIILTIWFIASANTVTFYKDNSWMVEASNFAGNFAQGIKEQLPILPQNSIVIYKLPEQNHRQALLDSHAIRTIYNDPSLTIYYNVETLIKSPDFQKNKPIYFYTPR